MKGLHAPLREQMVTHIYPDFNTLMNRTILLEEECVRIEGERKRKFLVQRARQQDRTQWFCTNNIAPTRYQPSMMYKSSLTQNAPNHRNNSINYTTTTNNSQLKNSSNTPPKVCFGCRQPGHHIAQCPYKATNSAPAQLVASNKTAASGIGRTTSQNSRPLKRSAPNFGQGCVNHVNAEEVQTAPDVVYGEFLANSTLATMLFNSGASHSFVFRLFCA